MSSIRTRLIVLLLPAWFGLILVGAFAVEYGLERYLVRELDAALQHKARTLATLVFDRGEQLEIEFADELMPEFSVSAEPEYFEILDERLQVMERSRSLGPIGIEHVAPGAREITTWNLDLPDGRRGRALALHVQAHYAPRPETHRPDGARSSPWVTIRVARSREQLEGMVDAMQTGIVVVCVVLALAVTFIALHAVRSGLRPLDALAGAVASIDPRHPKLAIDPRDVPAELEPIHERLVDLLARLDAALARERRFTSAAAHELRTPIAELRTLSEVALKWPVDGGRLPQDALELAQRMEGVVTSLLDLTRAESTELECVRVSPRPWIDAAIAAHAASTSTKALQVCVECPPELTFATDPRLALGAVRNIVDNALVHAPAGGQVSIRARTAGKWFELEASNPRGALTEADLSHLGEPFWRRDSARSDPWHVGLGLALTRGFARALGGEVTFTLDGELFCARLCLPAHDSTTATSTS